jgi:hypothetical protein
MDTIDAVLYINLDLREDRNKSIQKELTNMQFEKKKIHRISAVYDKVCGHLGCGLSHIKALDLAIENKWDRIIILEDDYHFYIKKEALDKIIKDADTVVWDVLLLAQGHIQFFDDIKTPLRRVKTCTTTSGYVVNSTYYKTLRDNFNESVTKMNRQIEIHTEKHNGIYWEKIGNEFETIKVPIGSRVRYGTTATYFIEKTVYVENFKACNDFFGGDPHIGNLKYVQLYKPKNNETLGWKTIGFENQQISVPKGSRVRYGRDDTYYIEKNIEQTEFRATNAFFGGDPAIKKQKKVQLYTIEKIDEPIPRLVHGVSAIDINWRSLQERDNFYISDPVAGHQGGFSSDTF